MEDTRRIHKFYGTVQEDFQLWQARTEAALQSKEVLHVVVCDAIGTEDPEALPAETQLAIAQARAIIIQGLGDRPLRVCISEKRNPYKMWARIKDRHAVVNVATRVQVQSRLSRMSYTSQDMPQYIDTFEEIFNRLAGMNCPIAEELQVAMLLASFGDKSKSPYGQVVASLQTVNETLSWESVSACLLQEYEEKELDSNGSRMNSAARRGMHEKGLAFTAGRKHVPRRKGFKLAKGPRAETRTCFECDQVGHLARNFPLKKGQALQAENVEKPEGPEVKEATMMVACRRNVDCSSDVFKSNLVLDSGASDHMVNSEALLFNVQPIPSRSIVMGNGHTVSTSSMGEMRLCTAPADGKNSSVRRITILRDVLYVPGLRKNIVSVSCLANYGYNTRFGYHGECSVMNNGVPHLRGNKIDSIYYLNTIVIKPPGEFRGGQVNTAGSSSNSSTQIATQALGIWHQRLGHASPSSISQLLRMGAVRGMDTEVSNRHCSSCTACQMGKNCHSTLRTRPVGARSVGQVIHSDLCGPMSSSSLGGSRYFVTFIDEYSRYVTVIPLAKKSNVASQFIKLQRKFERKFDCNIKALHSDSGGEYTALETFLEEQVIEVSRSAAYCPEQNGISERANRTLVESARAMLEYGGLPNSFWAEAICVAANLRNRFISPRSQTQTPYEMITGDKPRMDHLRVFGARFGYTSPKSFVESSTIRQRKESSLVA